jgi:hypothetical protein
MMRFGIQQIKNIDTLDLISETCEHDYPDISDAASIKIDVLTIATDRRHEIETWIDDIGQDDQQLVPDVTHTSPRPMNPYARNLSRELRLPMQGVVGMLDLMHATIEQASEEQNEDKLRTYFEDLRQNIKVVQGTFSW